MVVSIFFSIIPRLPHYTIVVSIYIIESFKRRSGGQEPGGSPSDSASRPTAAEAAKALQAPAPLLDAVAQQNHKVKG